MDDKNTGAGSTAAVKHDRKFCENEFERYCESNGIAYDVFSMNEEEADSFNDIKNRFIEACQDERVEVDGTSVKYTISQFSAENFKGETVLIKRPSGMAFAAMDSFKEKESVKKLHGFISSMTGKDVSYFTKIDIIDWKFFNAIATLFLGL